MDGRIWTHFVSQPSDHSCHNFPRTIFPYWGPSDAMETFIQRQDNAFSTTRTNVSIRSQPLSNQKQPTLNQKCRHYENIWHFTKSGSGPPHLPKTKRSGTKFSPKAETTSSEWISKLIERLINGHLHTRSFHCGCVRSMIFSLIDVIWRKVSDIHPESKTSPPWLMATVHAESRKISETFPRPRILKSPIKCEKER